MSINALDLALQRQWAMEEEPLRRLIAIAARQDLDPELARQRQAEHDARPDAIALQGASKLAGTRTGLVRDHVAIFPVLGAIFPRANVMTEHSGATSCQTLARDLAAAVADPDIKSILLEVDSPGGAVDGVRELAGHVAAMKGKKPIHCYASGTCASAAYWLATACDTITIASTARVGSIGVLVALPGADAGEIVIVSSQSPKKRPDLATEEGRGEVQRTLDDLAALFVADVARYRGVTESAVLSDYGQGGVFVGRRALKCGMVDRIGTLEGCLRALASGNPPQRRALAEGDLAPEADATLLSVLPYRLREPITETTTATDTVVTETISEPAPAAVSFEAQIAAAHVAVAGCLERGESLRRLSTGRLTQLTDLHASLGRLLQAAEPRPDPEAMAALHRRALSLQADVDVLLVRSH